MDVNDLKGLYAEVTKRMHTAIEHVRHELAGVRTGRASPALVDNIHVDYYGSPTILNQVSNISVMDARTLTIQPWEKNMLQPIERAIINANLGVTPQNDGNIIRLFMPPLTEERRKEFVKRAGGETPAELFLRQGVSPGRGARPWALRSDAWSHTARLHRPSSSPGHSLERHAQR